MYATIRIQGEKAGDKTVLHKKDLSRPSRPYAFRFPFTPITLK